jgi:hypothetical protein
MMGPVTTPSARRLAWTAPLLALLLLAAALRLPTVTAALPYFNYVDEGHVLHHSARLLAEGTWDPRYYTYPSLPIYTVAAAAWGWSPVYAALHGRPLRKDLSPPFTYYDILEPSDLLVAGRLVNLALALGIILLTGLLARRLAGEAAGLFAAWLAALIPALVIRGAIVNVDPYATFFSLAALLFAEGARQGPRPRRQAALAGAMVGLAAVSKYPAVLVALPVAIAVLYAELPWRERLRNLFLAGACSAAAAAVAMPALVVKTGTVIQALRDQSAVYAGGQMGSYWYQAVHRAEWDLPLEHPELGIVFLVLVTAGLAVALLDRRWSRSVQGWVLFAAALGLLLSPYTFRVLRNFLALVPLAVILVALLYAKLREAVPRRIWVDLAAAVLPLLLWAPALSQYVHHQLTVEDTRELAIDWLARHTEPDDRILFVEELAFLPSRIATLGPRGENRPWREVAPLIEKRRARYLVLGNLTLGDGRPRIRPSFRPAIFHRYQTVAQFGSEHTFVFPGAHKGNYQTIYILKRMPRRAGKARSARGR